MKSFSTNQLSDCVVRYFSILLVMTVCDRISLWPRVMASLPLASSALSFFFFCSGSAEVLSQIHNSVSWIIVDHSGSSFYEFYDVSDPIFLQGLVWATAPSVGQGSGHTSQNRLKIKHKFATGWSLAETLCCVLLKSERNWVHVDCRLKKFWALWFVSKRSICTQFSGTLCECGRLRSLSPRHAGGRQHNMDLPDIPRLSERSDRGPCLVCR